MNSSIVQGNNILPAVEGLAPAVSAFRGLDGRLLAL